MHASLTRIYLLALGIVALVLVFSYVAARALDRDAGQYAHLINIGGQQRMLSQRIALLAADVPDAGSGTLTRTATLDLLGEATSLMSANHAALGSDWKQGVLRKQGATDDSLQSLDQQVTRFLSLATQLRSNPDTDAALTQANALHTMATGEFLPALDAVVTRYQQIADRSVQRALVRQRFQLIVGLVALLGELLFIFRPMVRSTVAAVRGLHQSNERLRDVGYRLSHDLRAPVASSLGLVSLADESLAEKDVDEARSALQRVGRSLEGLDQYIGDMNRVIDHPTVAAPVETLGLRSCLQASIDKLSHMPGFDRLTIENDVPAELAWTGETSVLLSILENLLSNAIKYADPEKARARLTVSACRSDDGIRIELSDNGLGVPRPQQGRLFERFERFHQDHASGSGLGLHLARESARRLGGDLTYRALADGSCFTVTLADEPDTHGTTRRTWTGSARAA